MDIKFKNFEPKYLKPLVKYMQINNLADSIDLGIFSNHPYRKHLKKCGFIFCKQRGALFVHDIDKANLPQEKELWEIN